MMEIYQKNKKAFLFGGIFLALIILYFMFFSGSSAPAPDATAGGLVSPLSQSPAGSADSQELLATLAKLNSISLDKSIFSSVVFLSLEDKSRMLLPEPLGKALGRRNPFSGFGEISTTTTATSTPRLPATRRPSSR